MPYRGLLYAGLMLTDDGPRVVEFNCRFGDPECQPILMAMDSDLLPLLAAVAAGRLREERRPVFHTGATLCVVLVSDGYPGSYPKGLEIRGADTQMEDVFVFHAGTRRDEEGTLRTAGGRVLGVTARGATVSEARDRAYGVADQIHWEGVGCRRDIAFRALTAKGAE